MTNPLADLSNILSSLTPEDLQRLLQRLAEESEPTAQRIRYLLQPRAAVLDIARRIVVFRRSQPISDPPSYRDKWTQRW